MNTSRLKSVLTRVSKAGVEYSDEAVIPHLATLCELTEVDTWTVAIAWLELMAEANPQATLASLVPDMTNSIRLHRDNIRAETRDIRKRVDAMTDEISYEMH